MNATERALPHNAADVHRPTRSATGPTGLLALAGRPTSMNLGRAGGRRLNWCLTSLVGPRRLPQGALFLGSTKTRLEENLFDFKSGRSCRPGLDQYHDTTIRVGWSKHRPATLSQLECDVRSCVAGPAGAREGRRPGGRSPAARSIVAPPPLQCLSHGGSGTFGHGPCQPEWRSGWQGRPSGWRERGPRAAATGSLRAAGREQQSWQRLGRGPLRLTVKNVSVPYLVVVPSK